MAALIPADRHCSYERDGFVFFGEAVQKGSLEAASGVAVTLEEYMGPVELLTWAAARYPYIDWEQRSTIDTNDIRWARCHAEASLRLTNKDGAPQVPRNHSDFATVVAAEVEAFVYIPRRSSTRDLASTVAG